MVYQAQHTTLVKNTIASLDAAAHLNKAIMQPILNPIMRITSPLGAPEVLGASLSQATVTLSFPPADVMSGTPVASRGNCQPDS